MYWVAGVATAALLTLFAIRRRAQQREIDAFIRMLDNMVKTQKEDREEGEEEDDS